jgi:hypothetical protein
MEVAFQGLLLLSTVIQFCNLLSEILQRSRFQFQLTDNVPLAECQMHELHKQSIDKDYLVYREKHQSIIDRSLGNNSVSRLRPNLVALLNLG